MADLRRRLSLPEVFMLCVGSDRPHKNLAVLLAAQARLGGRAPLLVVAGMQSGDGRGRRLAARLGLDASRVRWLGTVSDADLPVLYGAARALLFPSLAEGFGLPLLEALACGTAVIASDVPSLREIGGSRPVFLSPGDTGGWCEAMRRAAAASPIPDEASCRAHLSGFTWTRAAEGTLSAYRAALARRASGS